MTQRLFSAAISLLTHNSQMCNLSSCSGAITPSCWLLRSLILMMQVPVVNRSNQPVHVTADLRGGEAFSGPKDITVAPGQTAAYPLTFRAPWIGDYVGNLDLNFPATGMLAVCHKSVNNKSALLQIE